jgi:lipoyl synthase
MRRCIPSFCSVAATAAASSVAGSASKISTDKQKFLDEFRAKLSSDTTGKNDLDGFVDAPEPTPISAASVGPVKRGAEPLPKWLKLKIPKGATQRPKYNRILQSMKDKKLSTVCQEAKCPNIGECWGGGDATDEHGGTATATIMLMGSHCTRGCRFCSVMTSRTPPPLDPHEPTKTAEAVSEMGVDYIVLTMVDRDDLADGGAHHVKQCITDIKNKSPHMLLEALVGDFRGDKALIEVVASSPLNVYAHNIECVERVTPNVRDRRAKYRQTLEVLEHASRVAGDRMITKSSIMLGLGEEEHEIRQTLRDLRTAGVSAVTLGQYLQPSRTRMKVSRYAHPDEFAMWEREALAMGFVYCASGPMVRSSYRAGEYYLTKYLKQRDADKAAAAASASP